MTEVNWRERASKLAELDGDEWDTEHSDLEVLWKAAYRASFEQIAKQRGMPDDDDNIEVWISELIDEAWIDMHQFGCDPYKAAEFDVMMIEQEGDS